MSVCGQKESRIEFVTKDGRPLPIAHGGGPRSPPQTPQCDRYKALWWTEHAGVLIYVDASCLVADVIGQKQSLVLNCFFVGGGIIQDTIL